MATLDTLDAERRTYAEDISDERRQRVALQAQVRAARAERIATRAVGVAMLAAAYVAVQAARTLADGTEIGRASCRERV